MPCGCAGEKGIVPPGKEGAGKPYHFKGKPFYRIIDAFIDQSGAETESVFGGMFKDDPGGLRLKHDRKVGVLCRLWALSRWFWCRELSRTPPHLWCVQPERK
jgi:hypothetical protein